MPGVGEAEGGVDGEAQLIGDDGKAIVYGGAPNLGFSIADGDSSSTRSRSSKGAWPGPDEVVIDEATADKEDFEVGQTSACRARAGRAPAHLRRRQVRLGLDDRRRDARRLRPADGAAALRQAGQARRDRGRREAGTSGPSSSCAEIKQVLPPNAQVRARLRAGGGGRVRDERVHHVPPGSSCSSSRGSRSSSAAS